MRFLLLIIFIVLNLLIYAQVPALIPYQAVARDASGQALNSATINARFTIHDGAATGAAVWQELQTVTTTALGLFTAQLGSSVALTGVNWANGSKFMQVEIDLGQGFVDLGTQQMLSVPYSLFSSNAQNSENSGNGYSHVSLSGDTLYFQNGEFVIIPGISDANNDANNINSRDYAPFLNPNLVYGSMTDQEGNVYETIEIGTQVWMAENLNTSIYCNGDLIPTNLDSVAWSNTTIGAYNYMFNDEYYSCPYGKLYNWYACTDERKLCPLGWHVPSVFEFMTLIDFLDPNAEGGSNLTINNVAGGKMKSDGAWLGGGPTPSNSSGFSALLGGSLSQNGMYSGLESFGFFWNSTEGGGLGGFYILSTYNDGAYGGAGDFNDGYSVRCLRD